MIKTFGFYQLYIILLDNIVIFIIEISYYVLSKILLSNKE